MHLFRSTKASVSLFLVLTIVPIFLFHAVLIDFARIQLAEKQVEASVKLGVRSALSQFDPKLQAYGLFGLTASSEELFAQVFAENLSPSLNGSYLHFSDAYPESGASTLTPMYMLANHTVLKRQIMEEMKYKAPINFSLEIADKFKKTGLNTKLQAASSFSEKAHQLDGLMDKRDTSLEEAWSEAEQLNEKVKQYYNHYQTRLSKLNSLANEVGLRTIDELRAELQSIELQIQSLLNSHTVIEGAISELSSRASELERLIELIVQYTALVALTKTEVALNANVLNEINAIIANKISEAIKINDEMKAILNNNSDINVRILADSYFQDFKVGAASVAAIFEGFRHKVEATWMFTGTVFDGISLANSTYFEQNNRFYLSQKATEDQLRTQRKTIETEKRAQKNAITRVLDGAKAVMGSCSVMESVGLQESLYSDLHLSYRKYYQTASSSVSEHPVDVQELKNTESTVKNAMELLAIIGSAAESMRDEFYLDEFALSKFNYRTLGIEKQSNGVLKKALTEPSLPLTHKLANQEAEYILYGWNSCATNFSAVYGEMFALRLGIRTMEALMDPKKELLQLGSPLLVLLAASAEGATKAFTDMSQLTDGLDIPISSKLPDTLSMGYKDYLRLFFLIHSRDKPMLSRMQALIELNSGIPLNQATTYVQGKGTANLRLWFVPALMKPMHSAGILHCKIEGNRCQMGKVAYFSY